MLLSRCNFNAKWTWRSNMNIPFSLKWHYCHIGFVNIHHNFEFTYLHLNYSGCPVGVSQKSKHLRTKMTDLFMTDINDINNWYKCRKTSSFHFENTCFILRFYYINFLKCCWSLRFNWDVTYGIVKTRCDKTTDKCCQTERWRKKLKLCRSDWYQKVDNVEEN